jgi:ammonia channel protein AmtB
MLWLINRVTAVRVGDTAEELGLDASLHREQAYVGIE